MDEHRRYEKVHRLEKDECEGLLSGEVYIFEKLDGANASVWLDSDSRLCIGSRNNVVARGDAIRDEFRGLVPCVQSNVPICNLLTAHPNLRLFGEWLVKHTINYPKEHMNKFYVFDVYDEYTDSYLPFQDYSHYLEECGVLFLKPLANVTEDYKAIIDKYLGYSDYNASPSGEGLVIKNYNFTNKFGRQVYGKIVTKDFREVHSVTWPTAPKEDVESRIVSKYITEARVRKIAEKHDLREMKDIPKLFGMVYNDLITEDMWDILKKFKNPSIDFKKFYRMIQQASKSYYIDIIQEK